jgi:hypothetical protein
MGLSKKCEAYDPYFLNLPVIWVLLVLFVKLDTNHTHKKKGGRVEIIEDNYST